MSDDAVDSEFALSARFKDELHGVHQQQSRVCARRYMEKMQGELGVSMVGINVGSSRNRKDTPSQILYARSRLYGRN